MTWTLFWDMHSGGYLKEPPYETIYIEAPATDAKAIFYSRFGHNPERVTCTCCGDDYSINESSSFEEASAWQRNAHDWTTRAEISVEEYLSEPNLLVIRADEIKPSDLDVVIPAQGYVWVD